VRRLRGHGAAALVAAALVVALPSVARAHDPGLSALDVRIVPDSIRVTLSIAASDAKQVTGSIDAFAGEVLALTLDGLPLAGAPATDMASSDAGLTFTVAFNRAAGSRLTIGSGVPGRLAVGHRQLLTVHADDGSVVMERMLDARSAGVVVDLAALPRRSSTAAEFFTLGLRHILGGYDHILFLIALLIGVRRLRGVVSTVTAFTLAHSVTLSLAVLGLVVAPPALIEPLIAGSIVFVGIENLVRRPADSRWKLTFLFGLVHGFGFAGALTDLGVGSQAGVAVPLGFFNAGVEAGQVLVVLALWPLLRALNGTEAWRGRLAPASSLVVAIAGCYWLFERTFL
jgi:hypothetical protein